MDQIIDISQDGRHLSRDRGFLLVQDDDQIVGRVPLDQIAAVIVHAHGCTWTGSLLTELADRGSLVVLCAANHQPRAVIWPMEGHHAQGARMRAQWAADAPMMKQAWKQIIVAKLRMQAAALAALDQPHAMLSQMTRRVQSGDTTNVEAQAARAYWPLLMGKDFRRNVDLPDVNALLNYGYTVLRAATARAVVAAGLHPTIGLFHANRGNAFALADDLMEPFRPLVDMTARRIALRDGPDVTSEAKRALARLIAFDLPFPEGTTPVSVALSRLATSLGQSFETRKLSLALPEPPTPLVLAGLGT